jgi:arsenate reductase (glutaredoxin)
MQFHPNELFLLYNPHTSGGKQTKAIALALTKHINEIDAIHEKLGPTYWKEVVNLLKLEPKELLDRSSTEYQAKVAGNSFTMNGWLDVLMHNPQLLRAPIAIYNGVAILCEKPTDVLKLQFAPKGTQKIPPHLKNDH